MRHVVIMAGGSGTRLWPLSRKGTPKQLLPLIDGASLLRLTFERARLVVPPQRIVVVTGAPYADQVAELVPELSPENIFGEPVGRDSLNAAAWPAAVLAARDPDAVVAQLPSDGVLEPADVFAAALDTAFRLAEADPSALVTFGVVPTAPHTGYGYLRRGEPVPGFDGACRLLGFTEKPSLEVAERYLASGEYWWNAGMFVWRAATFLDQLRQLSPQTYAGVTRLAAAPQRLGELFGALPKTSIDYAVMEPVAGGRTDAHVVAVALDVDWRDVGGYQSLAEFLPTDAAGNAVLGDVVALDARGNIVVDTDPGTVVGLVGVTGLIVVRTPQATLVVPADQAQRVKDLVAAVVAEKGVDFA